MPHLTTDDGVSLFYEEAGARLPIVLVPGTGHALNLEEPDDFNVRLDRFFHTVDSGAWRGRDPRATEGSILGTK